MMRPGSTHNFHRRLADTTAQRGAMASLTSRLPISLRIGLGFGTILLLLLAVGGLGGRALTEIQQQFQAYTMMTAEADHAAMLQAELLAARLGVRDFLGSGRAEDYERVREKLHRLSAQLSEDRKRDPRGLEAPTQALERYSTALAGIAEREAERRRIGREVLDRVGLQSERLLTEIADRAAFAGSGGTAEGAMYANDARRALFGARLASQRYETDRAAESATRVQADLQKLEEALSALDSSLTAGPERSMADQVRRLTISFAEAFETRRRLTVESDALLAETLDPSGAILAQFTEAIQTRARGDQQALGVRAADAIETAQTLGLALVATATVIGLLASTLIARSLSAPVVAMTRAMEKLARGDLTVLIPGVTRRDEIGAMALAVEVFRTNAKEALRLEALQASERAAKEQRTLLVDRLLHSFEGVVGAIVHTVSSAAVELDASATSMASVASRTTDHATASVNAAEQTSETVLSVASASDQIATSVARIATHVQRSTSVTRQAVRETDETNARVQSLTQAAARIGDVVHLIAQIADQTNLLALNATIEAARAGDAGRGFAVVATEVKNLAAQTAQATEEIGVQINAIQTATHEAVEAIKHIGGTVTSISAIADAIAAAVDEQAEAIEAIADNVSRAVSSSQDMAGNVRQVCDAALETGDTASHVLEAADALSRDAETLRGEVNRFLAGIRAA